MKASEFLKTLEASAQKPKNLIYMSCAPDTWAKDGKALENLGYHLKEAFVADQFPQTKHFEILSHWLLQRK